MITSLLIYIGFLTLFIVGLIHHYEAKLRDLQGAISDYKRALNIAKKTTPPQYESHVYKSSTWESDINYQQEEIDFEQ